MKTLACFIKTFKENIRDWKILILAIVFAPFFIYMMYMYMGDSGSSVYNVVLINNDEKGKISNELIDEWKKMKTEDGKSLLKTLPEVSGTGKSSRLLSDSDLRQS